MQKKDYDFQFKLVLVGDTGVGKSSVLFRFVDDIFHENNQNNVGVDFRFRTVKSNSKKNIKLQIWDTAGQEKFRTITSAYYRGADGIVMVFDIYSENSFKHINDWLQEVNRYAAEDSIKILMGNKTDKGGERVISTSEAQKYADSLGISYFETSAKNSTNIELAFAEMAEKLINNKEKRSRSMVSSSSTAENTLANLNSTQRKDKKSGCC